jgi:hypothetical protein
MGKWENVLSPSPLERGWGEAKPSPPARQGAVERHFTSHVKLHFTLHTSNFILVRSALHTSTFNFPRSVLFRKKEGGLRLLLWYSFKSKISEYEKEVGVDGNGRDNSEHVRCVLQK